MFCISTQGSERATTGPGTMIITASGKTHVVWQDSTTNGYFNRARTLDRASGKWSPVTTLNRGLNNHARPILTIDSGGFLHAVLSGHNSPTTYRQSKRPHDTSEWTEPVEVGPGTYPVMSCGGDDTLYLTLRAGNHAGVDLYVKPPGKPWQKPLQIIRRHPDYPGYLAAPIGLAFGPDGRTLHLVCDFYESKDWQRQFGVHQAVAYMRSPDGGKTWQRADGSPMAVPARPETMDKLAQDIRPRSEQLPPVVASGGSIVVDSTGRPFVFYISHLKKLGELILATPDAKGRWQQRALDAIEKSHPGFWPTSKTFTIADDDALVGVVSLMETARTKLNDGVPTRATRLEPVPGTPAVWMISRDGGKTFMVTPFLPAGPQATRCEFNLERAGLHNRIECGRRPGVLFFEGLVRYPAKGETIQNKVYWLETP